MTRADSAYLVVSCCGKCLHVFVTGLPNKALRAQSIDAVYCEYCGSHHNRLVLGTVPGLGTAASALVRGLK